MRFDLQFLDRPSPEGDWVEPLAAVEGLAWSNEPMHAGHVARWDQLVERLADLLPDAVTSNTLTHRQLVDAETGIEVVFHPGQLSLSVEDLSGAAIDPDVAERLVLVRAVAARIAAETGLTGINPSTEAPFLIPEEKDSPTEPNDHDGDRADWRKPTL